MSNYGTGEYVFNIAINAENELARFYTGLMMKFKHLDCSEFLKTLAQDEIWHMKNLAEIRDSLSAGQLSSRANPTLLEEAERVRKLNIIDILESIENLEDAYESIKKLETSEINAVYSFLLSEFIDSDKKKKFLNSELKAHIDKIDVFKSRYL